MYTTWETEVELQATSLNTYLPDGRQVNGALLHSATIKGNLSLQTDVGQVRIQKQWKFIPNLLINFL